MSKQRQIHSRYRADIDGLRAISIIFILIQHISHEKILSGQIGIDIFFVISGYLITGILLREHAKGTCSIIRFYERRAKRILPVLFISIAVYYIVAYSVVKDCIKEFSENVISSVLMIQNLWIVRNDYRQRVLHMPQRSLNDYNFLIANWSLRIEEQFYMVWPFILACIYQLSPFQKYTIVGFLIVLSYGSAMILAQLDVAWPDGYYFPLSRYWELFVGCLLALVQFDKQKENNYEDLQLLGEKVQLEQNQSSQKELVNSIIVEILYLSLNLTMIILAFVIENQGVEQTLYVIWAVIVIKCKNTFFNQQILGSKLLVFIGKLSYSIYMWHFGIIMLMTKQMPHLAIAVTIIGVLIYPIENMLRESKHPYTVPSILAFGFILLAIAFTVWLS